MSRHNPFEGNIPPKIGAIDLSKIASAPPPPPKTFTQVFLASCQVAADFKLEDKDTVAYCELSIHDLYFNVQYVLRFPESELQGLMGILEGMQAGMEKAKAALNDDAA